MEGDSNTCYFHRWANQRNKRNFIVGLEDSADEWVEDEGQMGAIVEEYFQSIFTLSKPFEFESILQGIHPAISEEAAGFLSCEFHVDDFWAMPKQMAPLTAPSLDGMSPIFYKSFWHIVGEDLTVVVLKALNLGVVPESLNSTFTTLIPKVKQLRKVSDFRLVSLCNVVY